MKTQSDNPTQFTNFFREEYGFELQADEAKDALGRLSKLFDLLDQFDREDRQTLNANGEKKYNA
ncbi:MAG: hypothetical protein UW22_C0002G0004 [Candidatus Gottesmanbacteria bacterium GW2011_GWB1_44_11c]|uniref:Uncharacterized protein n=2 Tax=Candidatus Gottesmaniibacteriota TaxID=1752720 RepID=A0A0G1IQQ5_9BACT|nr:MAG: hypothetical protein UW22_C0002G0004 [Candidatus Gottesmanbacteria bacterium GW2011_GWB1_44_11c]KKT61490.1 MAG: hypothetical protein UW52_C0002G0004 [Candidatus Gottesmanbacteria bacterium GW2011_GWA1_44_24b]